MTLDQAAERGVTGMVPHDDPVSLLRARATEDAAQFAIEAAIALERSVIAEMLQKLEGHFWYPMAAGNLKELRERVGL